EAVEDPLGLAQRKCAQTFDRERVAIEEVDDGAGPVMAGRVVGAAREAIGRTRAIGDALAPVGEVREVAEPAGVDRAQAGVGRDAEPTAALTPLRVLVAARGHEDRIGAERSEEHTSELQSRENLVCRLLLEKK